MAPPTVVDPKFYIYAVTQKRETVTRLILGPKCLGIIRVGNAFEKRERAEVPGLSRAIRQRRQ
jgi:hypothetical protein